MKMLKLLKSIPWIATKTEDVRFARRLAAKQDKVGAETRILRTDQGPDDRYAVSFGAPRVF